MLLHFMISYVYIVYVDVDAICICAELIDVVCWLQEGRYVAGVQRFDFDAGLAPYPLHLYHQWQQLSGHITQQLMDRLEPVRGEGEGGGPGEDWEATGGRSKGRGQQEGT